jgi:hypothetical protein
VVKVVDGQLEVVGPSISDNSGLRKYEYLRFRDASGRDVLIKEVFALELVASYLHPDITGRFIFGDRGMMKLIVIQSGDRVVDDCENWRKEKKMGYLAAAILAGLPFAGGLAAALFKNGVIFFMSLLFALPAWLWAFFVIFVPHLKYGIPDQAKVDQALSQG